MRAVEGGDHRVDRVSAPGSPRPTSTVRASPTSRSTTSSPRARPGLRGEAARVRRGARRRGRACGCTRHGPSIIRLRRCATRPTWCSSKATRSASSCSTGAAPGGGPTRRGHSATSSTRPRTSWRAKGATVGVLAREADPSIDEVAVAVLPARSRWPTVPACSPRSRPSSVARGVSIRSMNQRGIGDDARLIFVTHKAREADAAGHGRRLAERRGGAPRGIGAAGHGGGGVTASVARRDRGVPRAPARHRLHSGHHAARGQHAAARRRRRVASAPASHACC